MRELISDLADRVIEGCELSQEEKKFLFLVPNNLILHLVSEAYRIKLKLRGKRVSTCSIISARTGYCSEDCAFCAQSIRSRASIEKHKLIPPEKIVNAAMDAEKAGAERFSIVTSGKGFKGGKYLDKILEAVKLIRQNTSLKIDVSLGILSEKAIEKLKKAGVERIHHNIETSPSYFNKIVTSHRFEERVETIRKIKKAGVEACSGFIIGMGENISDRIEIAEVLNALNVDSVPINLLIPIKGTPLENLNPIEPLEALKSIAAFRFLMPDKELRLCGGRVQILRDLQSLAVFIVDGILIGQKALTTNLREPELDIRMLRDLGFDA